MNFPILNQNAASIHGIIQFSIYICLPIVIVANGHLNYSFYTVRRWLFLKQILYSFKLLLFILQLAQTITELKCFLMKNTASLNFALSANQRNNLKFVKSRNASQTEMAKC